MSVLVSLFASHVWTVELFFKKIFRNLGEKNVFVPYSAALMFGGELLMQYSCYFHSSSLTEWSPIESDLDGSN